MGEIAQAIGFICGGAELEPAASRWLHKPGRRCACGATMDGCPLWGPLVREIRGLAPIEAHRRVVDRFGQEYPGRLLVDSSKDIRYLERYYLSGDGPSRYDLKVIFLVRDFRGWVVSIRKHKGNHAIRDYGYIGESYRWFHANSKYEKYLRQRKQNNIRLVYDSLIFDMDAGLNRLEGFLGLEGLANYRVSRKSVTHDIFGSTMKDDVLQRSAVRYDATWLHQWQHVVLWPFLIPIYHYNGALYRKS